MILTVVEIILLARHKLTPKTFVIMNTIKSTVWAGLFLYDLATVVRYDASGEDNSRVSGVGLLIMEAILLYVSFSLSRLLEEANMFQDVILGTVDIRLLHLPPQP